MKIFAGHDGGTGCMYYRVELPLRQLEARGHEITFRSTATDKDVEPLALSDMAGFDIVIGQRYNTFDGMGTWRRARTPLNRLVYEIDDDVWSVPPENWQAYHAYRKADVQDAVAHMAEVADLITVTTEHLASVMREHTGNEHVAVLPNCVPAFVLDLPRKDNPRPAVGWQGGASHGADVGVISTPVRRFLERFPGWDLRLGGTDYRPTFRAGDRAKYSQWVRVFDDAPGYFETIDFDIGLAPLAAGREFNKSKSNIKVLEYGARGIPSIATDCEVYRSFVRHGENGFLVKRDHEWLHYLSILASDGDLRRKMGEAARADAAKWTIEEHAVEWERAYASLFRV